MLDDRIKFLEEIDTLKEVWRQTLLLNGKRRENAAEHSWSLALAVLLFADMAEQEIASLKAVKMALIHDLVEIYAGDTFAYGSSTHKEQHTKEAKALDELVNIIPASSFSVELKQLWHEYEAGESPEAQFVQALDRLLPLICNWKTQGYSWRQHNVTSTQVRQRAQDIQNNVPQLAELTEHIINDSIAKGYLAPFHDNP